ncbi:MAG: MBL fold metallo-hydrolase [Syntrophomonadaceae bacterium]
MKIRWRGHASFLIETNQYRIISDPFDKNLGYPLVREEADIVTVSHEHYDHNAVETILGNPQIIRGTGRFALAGAEITGFPSFHDKSQGKQRGPNTIYKIVAEGLSVVHLGDLGDILNRQQIDEIGNVDILLIPVGGVFTINGEEAWELVNLIKPQVTIPMHFNTSHLSFDLLPVENFSQKFDKVVKMPLLEVNLQNIKEKPAVVVLDYLF